MILLFPDLDTLRVALTSGTVPADVALAPAAVTADADGHLYVEPTAALPKATGKALDRLGVKGSKRHAGDAPEAVSCWPQILPLVREAGPPALSSQAPVLFELASADDLPGLVTEMLRLGNDRQGFRWFAPPGAADARRVLLRVVGPPYYTLLRALDRPAGGAAPVRAYVERAPRVWVEVGHAHPLAAQIRAPDGQLILVRPPREWVFLDDAPFQDVYDGLQFRLPAAPVAWAPAPPADKMTVPLRLAAGNAADVPELWVLRENAVEQLDTLVRDADDRLLQRLTFAVAADPAGGRTVVLRTRPSKLAPPALPLDHAVGFKPYWKLPNLFVPAGKRLHPTLRRDTVRRLLADDADQVVWLYPDGAGGFTPEAVPDGAFRSLEDWVDYVIEADRAPLAAWVGAARFEFDHFVCKDGGGPKPKPDKGAPEPAGADDPAAPRDPAARPPARGKGPARAAGPAEFVPPPAEDRPPGEWVKRKAELEERFRAVDGPLDAPERQALWPELAAAYMGVGKAADDAALAWLNALWDADPMPAEWLARWAQSEFGADGQVRAEDLDRRLNAKAPSVADARAVVAGFLRAAQASPPPPWLLARLPAVQKYLEAHEPSLPVRAVWLAGYRLAQLTGGDALGLARVRDRLLQRLLDRGLEPERDLPSFLRFAGLKDSDRLRAVRGRAQELHQAVRKWTAHVPVNLPYVDLLFAFALAKLGEASAARGLAEEARPALEGPVPPAGNPQQDQAVTAAVVRNFLLRAFRYRVDQALAGKPHGGPLPADLAAELDGIARQGGAGPVNNPHKLAEYVVARMREQSRVIEPQEKPDPYAAWTRHGDPLKAELAALPAVREPARLADRVRKLLRDGVPGKAREEVQFHALHEALPLSTRVGEAFTVELLGQVPAALTAGLAPRGGPEPPDAPKKQGELLERAIFHAAHFDRPDLVQRLVGQFIDLVHGRPEEARFKLVNAVGGEALRSLRKLGLRDEIDRLLGRLQTEVLQGKSLADLRKRYAAKPELWAAVLQTLLNLAAGWLTFGLNDHAAPILDEARAELLSPAGLRLQPKDYTELARAYVAALGQGPAEAGLPRIVELFRVMDPGKITNTWTTAPYYSRLHLNLVETVVLAVVSDEFALGPAGRRWLDDDEYLVRRRVHADMRRYLDRERL